MSLQTQVAAGFARVVAAINALKSSTLRPATQANIVVATAEFGQYSATVVDTAVTASSKVLAWLSANDDFDADELGEFHVVATASAGAVEFFIMSDGPIVGTFTVNYIVG